MLEWWQAIQKRCQGAGMVLRDAELIPKDAGIVLRDEGTVGRGTGTVLRDAGVGL